jgi:minor extracellular serine protease Vpr
MKRKILYVLLAAMLVFTSTALAQSSGPAGLGRHDYTEAAQADFTTEYIMVKFKDPPAASYEGGIPGLERTKPLRGKFDPNSPAAQAYLKHLENEHANYRSWLASNAKGAEVVREFSTTFNGMAIKLNNVSAQRAAGGPGARAWAFSSLYRPTMNVSTDLIGADVLWGASPADAGAGVDVAIIDTGIQDGHPFFACKSIDHHGPYYSGVAPGATNPFPTIIFDHGTHVAGTVGGCVSDLATIDPDGPIVGPISGVAPGVTLHDFNVFPGIGAGLVAFGGSAFSHDIAAAIEDAVLEPVDVINMSIGGTVQGPHDFLAEASDAAVDAGVVVVVAAGNSGPGDSTVESPGSGHKVIAAGASTNPHFLGISLEVTPTGGSATPLGAALGDFDNFTALTADYTVTTPANGCSAISTNLTGKIALINRGVCTFTTKIRNAENAGAIGVLVVNSVAGDPVAMAHDGTDPFPTIPAAMLGKAEGNSIKPDGSVTFFGGDPVEILTSNEDIIAGFSSRGPTPFTYLIKPDVTAPGVNVYSSVFSFGPGGFGDVQYDFAMFQGTSMATPHTAGAAALLLDLHPGWSPADVKSALVNTGSRTVTDHVNGTVDPGVLARGGGRIDLPAADATPLTFDPASASFGLWTGNKNVSASLDLTVMNVSGGAQSCTVAVTGSSIVTASTALLSLGAGDSDTLTLTLAAGKKGDTGSGDYSGDVVIDCGGTVLQVPWWTRIDR